MEPKKKSFYKTFSSKENFDPCQEDSIYQCEDDDPPVRVTSSVKELCTIKTNFAIDYDWLIDFTGETGKRLKKLDYDIEMVPSGASNEFSILYEGEKLASQNARIDFQ